MFVFVCTYLHIVPVVCLCVCLFVHFSAFFYYFIIKILYCILSLCEYVCVLACRRLAVMFLHFCKFIASKIVCLCVCLHSFNYSIVVY